MKVILEGTEKQLNPIVQMLQGFAISISDEDGNSLKLEKKSQATNDGDAAAPEKSAKKKNKSKE